MKFKIFLCPLARKHHDESRRQFAHVFHKRNTVCVTPEFYDLPQGYQAGILLHEMGHLAIGPKDHTEDDADAAAFELTGVPIRRKFYRGMKRLEYVDRKNRATAFEFIRERFT